MSKQVNSLITEAQANEFIEKKRKKAEKLIANEKKFDEFLLNLEEKLKTLPCGTILSKIPVLVSIVKSFVKKEYTEIPINTITSVVAGLLYFALPIEIIPDSIPVIGYADDAVIFSLILKGVQEDLDRYLEWRDGVTVVNTYEVVDPVTE